MKPETTAQTEKKQPEVNEREKTQAQPPARLTGIKITVPPKTAAGLQGVVSGLKHVIKEMGLGGLTTLPSLNQMHGFDCPGCAWPDPDDKRSLLAEFCENGAKAVAEEATLKRADPDFFARHA